MHAPHHPHLTTGHSAARLSRLSYMITQLSPLAPFTPAKRLASSNRTGVSALDRRLEMEAMKEDHGVKGAKGDNCVIM
jgi:hypothetical protein